MKKSLRFTAYGLLLLTLTGCRTVRVVEQVPVEVHDTLRQKVFLHDSTYIDRWHTEYLKGDTVFITDQVTKTVTKTKTDTAYRYIERPVTVTRTEQVEVKKPLRWWQKGLMWCGALGILTALAAVALRLRRRAS